MGVLVVACALSWLVALSVYDIRDRRLPNWLTAVGAVAVFCAAVAEGRGGPALSGGLLLFGVYLTVYLLAPGAMGAGDVKLAFGVGALTGAFGVDVWLLAAIGAPLLTAGWTVVSVNRVVPHGPSMCMASASAVALTFC